MTQESALLSPSSWTSVLPLNKVFPENKPLEVDLGCGKGRFLLAHAERNPDVDFLGVDRSLARLKKIDERISKRGITNIKLLRLEATYTIRYLLPPHSVSALYIFFPDPWPKRRHHCRRLFSRSFIDTVDQVLKPEAIIHIATDNIDYFDDIQTILHSDSRFQKADVFEPPEEEKTDFEIIFLSQDAKIGRASYLKRS